MPFRAQLSMALDFAKDSKLPHEVFSYLHGGKWRVCRRGPGYCNIYSVMEFDAEGLAKLESIHRPEEDIGHATP